MFLLSLGHCHAPLTPFTLSIMHTLSCRWSILLLQSMWIVMCSLFRSKTKCSFAPKCSIINTKFSGGDTLGPPLQDGVTSSHTHPQYSLCHQPQFDPPTFKYLLRSMGACLHGLNCTKFGEDIRPSLLLTKFVVDLRYRVMYKMETKFRTFCPCQN